MYRKGRTFEYKIKNKLQKLGIEVMRNYLSRKPDLILPYFYPCFFEVKNNVKESKKGIPCLVYDFNEFFKQKINKVKEIKIQLKDKWYTISKIKNKIVVIIPSIIDKKYIENFFTNFLLQKRAFETFFEKQKQGG